MVDCQLFSWKVVDVVDSVVVMSMSTTSMSSGSDREGSMMEDLKVAKETAEIC